MSEAAVAKKTYTLKDLKKAPPVARPGRLPPLNVPEDYANLQYLDAEEKELVGIQLISRLEKFDNQATITVATAAHDPRAARIRSAWGGALMALAAPTYETRHLVGGSLLNLLVLSVVKHAKDECLLAGIASNVVRHHLKGFEPHHLMLLDYPDSEVWNAEQRLMLRYAKAILENTMTDELWKEAVEMWSPKMCVRYIHVLNFFHGASIMNRTLKVPYPVAYDRPAPDETTAINRERAEYRKRMGMPL